MSVPIRCEFFSSPFSGFTILFLSDFNHQTAINCNWPFSLLIKDYYNEGRGGDCLVPSGLVLTPL